MYLGGELVLICYSRIQPEAIISSALEQIHAIFCDVQRQTGDAPSSSPLLHSLLSSSRSPLFTALVYVTATGTCPYLRGFVSERSCQSSVQLLLHWITRLLQHSVLPFQSSHTPPRRARPPSPSTEIPASRLSSPPSGQGRPQPFASAYFAHRKRLIHCVPRLQIAICAGKSATTLYRLYRARRRRHARGGGTKRSGRRLFQKTLRGA